jgi:hypothetical protein
MAAFATSVQKNITHMAKKPLPIPSKNTIKKLKKRVKIKKKTRPPALKICECVTLTKNFFIWPNGRF